MSTRWPLLLGAALAGLVLIASFTLVVQQAALRGDAMRMQQRLTGQIGTRKLPAPRPQPGLNGAAAADPLR